MRRSHPFRFARRALLLIVPVLLAVVLLTGLPAPTLLTGTLFADEERAAWEALRTEVASVTSNVTAHREMDAVWARTKDAGEYAFTADVAQRSLPVASITNVGRQSRLARYYLSGEVNLPTESLNLVLWSQGGSILDPSTGVEVQVEGDSARARQGNGEWQEVNDFTGLFAPGGDFLTYLSAAKNVRQETMPPPSTQDGPTPILNDGGELSSAQATTRFTFDIDGPAFARHLRDQLQLQMIERGELPHGINLELPSQYLTMTGEGELWVDKHGLPLRQKLALEFPAEDGQDHSTQINITVQFSDFPSQNTPLDLAATSPGLSAAFAALQATLPAAERTAFVGLLLALPFLLIRYRRSRGLYRVLTVTLIASMLLSPLVHSNQVAAFQDGQLLREQAQAARAGESRMSQELGSLAARSAVSRPDGDALALIRNDNGADADSDGLSDVQESFLGSDPLLVEPAAPGAASARGLRTQPDDPTDSDSDGLTDYEESLLGTNPLLADSDSDGLSDLEEITGFEINGQRWYGDPDAVDTNRDGIDDRAEWNMDTDGDGTPDLHDFDNDGDGVPDRIDISPSKAGQDDGGNEVVFSNANPLNLRVDSLTPDKYTYVEFQLRPQDPDHLWYAFNVLDWPGTVYSEGSEATNRDFRGQITDEDGGTFFDVCVSRNGGDPTGCRMSPDANGDIRLVPMLEIRSSGGVGNFAPQADLNQYGIGVQELNADGSQVAAYVPLQLVTDPDGGEQVAFYGKMLYLPDGTWRPQQVRLVWAIQALLDNVCSEFASYQTFAPAFSMSNLNADVFDTLDLPQGPQNAPQIPAEVRSAFAAQGLELSTEARLFRNEIGRVWTIQDGDHRFRLVGSAESRSLEISQLTSVTDCVATGNNVPRVVHTYADDWTLTGLNVREDHGFELAIAYEDPAIDPDLNDDLALLALVNGLDQTFISARDCDLLAPTGECYGDGRADIDINEIGRRFNHPTNGGVPSQQRWEIDNILRVETFSYAHRDAGVGTTAQTETPRILAQHFTPAWRSDAPVVPTLLFARNERFRTANLERQGVGSQVRWSGSALSFNFKFDGGTPVQTYTGVNWAPYRYDEFAAQWRSMDIAAYWDELARRYGTPSAGEDPAEVAGRLFLTQFLYLIINHGHGRVTSVGELIIPTGFQTDEDVASIQTGLGIVQRGVVFLVTQIFLKVSIGPGDIAPLLAFNVQTSERLFGSYFNNDALTEQIGGAYNGNNRLLLKLTGAALIGILLLVSVALLVVAEVTDNEQLGGIATILLFASLFAVQILVPVVTINSIVSSINASSTSGLTPAVISVVFGRSELVSISRYAKAVGLLIGIGVIWGVFLYQVITSSLEPGSFAFNSLIATAIASTLVTVLLFVLGLTVIGTLTVAIFGLIDLLLLGLCRLGVSDTCNVGLISGLTTAFSMIIYGGGVSINTGRSDLVEIDALDVDLAQPERGFVVGNRVTISTGFTTNISHLRPTTVAALGYGWLLFNESTLRDTSFTYRLSDLPANAPEAKASLARPGQMRNEWSDVTSALFGYAGRAYSGPHTIEAVLDAGVNHPVPVYADIGYALPAYDCWFGICTRKTIQGSSQANLGPLFFDVLPATLSEFYDLQSWSTRFRVQNDADGDGLVSATWNGNDPNDSITDCNGHCWDSDGDGLSDRFEIERRAVGAANGGSALNARLADTDRDGLTDQREIRLGTNPALGDTDGDGLTDAEEVAGWLFTYAPGRTTQAFPDPLQVDGDGDGMSDLLEKRLYEADPVRFPFHPRAFNPSPVALYTELDDADSIVRQGDDLVYNAIVRNNLDADFYAGGDLTVTVPQRLGGGESVTNFTLRQGQSVAIQRNLTATGNGSATVSLDAEAQAVLLALGVNSGWLWGQSPVQYNTLSSSRLPWYTALAEQPSGYTLLTLESADPRSEASIDYPAMTATGLNNANIVQRQTSTFGAADPTVIARGFPGSASQIAAYSPDIACNDSGICLTVWSERADAGSPYAVFASLSPYPSNNTLRLSLDGSGQNLYPAVASDGQNFLVAWSRRQDGGPFEIVHRTVGVNAALGDTVNIARQPFISGANQHSLFVDLAWAAPHYQLVWEHLHDFSDRDIWATRVDAAGGDVPNSVLPVTDNDRRMERPKVAHDPARSRSLVVYSDGGSVRGRLISSDGLGTEIFIAGGEPTIINVNPQVSYATFGPNDGWVVGYGSIYSLRGTTLFGRTALSPDGMPRGVNNVTTWNRDVQSDAAAMLCGSSDCITATSTNRGQGSSLQVMYNTATLTQLAPPQGDFNLVNGRPVTIDDDAPTAGLTVGQFVIPGSMVVLGGEAADPTSYIDEVRVRVDGGNWQTVTGAESWAFAWDVPAGDGSYQLAVEATDAVGFTGGSTTVVQTDDTPPILSASVAEETILVPRRSAGGGLTVRLEGTVADALSGVRSVELYLTPGSGAVQSAQVTGNTWSVDYDLSGPGVSPALSDPFTVTVIALDNAEPGGNQRTLEYRVGIDSQAPDTFLNSLDAARVISQPITVSGSMVDPGQIALGVQSGEVAFVPAPTTDTISETVLLLPLDDAPNAFRFQDNSGADHRVFCGSLGCPTAQAPGRYGSALQFPGANVYLDAPVLDVPETGYTLSLWFNTTCPGCGLASIDRGAAPNPLAHDRNLFLLNGNLCADVRNSNGALERICSVGANYADGNWHQAVHTVGPGGQRLYVDGQLQVSGSVAASSFTNQTGFNLGFSTEATTRFFIGRMDEVAIYPAALAAEDVAALFSTWQPVVLDGAGPGVRSSTWTAQIPEGLEDFYQIDGRATDTGGNRNDRRGDWPQWRGEIDTLAPRIAIDVTHNGFGGGASTTYRATAEDLNLDESSFRFICAVDADDRGYLDSAWWQRWAGDSERLTSLTPSCTLPNFSADDVVLQACDVYGRCAATTPGRYVFYTAAHNSRAGGWQIERANLLDDSAREIIVGGLGQVLDLVVDVERNTIFWTERPPYSRSADGRLRRADLDGSNVQDVITGLTNDHIGMKGLSLEINPAANRIYWAEANRIRSANLDGSGVQTLFTHPPINGVLGQYTPSITDLAIDPQRQRMAWTVNTAERIQTLQDRFASQIWTANLDGTNVRNFRSNMVLLANLAFNAATGDLFWQQEGGIFRTDPVTFGAQRVRQLVRPLSQSPSLWRHLLISGQRLYWMDHRTYFEDTVGGAPLGARRTEDRLTPYAFAVAFVPAQTVNAGDLALQVIEGSDLAVPGQTFDYIVHVQNQGLLDTPNTQVVSTLPAGTSFSGAVGANCSAAGNTVTCDLGLLPIQSMQTVTLTLSVDSGASGTLVNVVSVSSGIDELTPADNSFTTQRARVALLPSAPPAGRVSYLYWGTFGQIVRAPLNSPTTTEVVVDYTAFRPDVIFAIEGLATDLNYIYWSDPVAGEILRANHDGSNIQTLISGLVRPSRMDIDSVDGKLYWIDRVVGFESVIQRANLDGSAVETVVTGMGPSQDLLVDEVRRDLLWIGYRDGVLGVYRTTLDGQNEERLLSDVWPWDIELDRFDRTLYWTDYVNERNVRRVPITGPLAGQPSAIETLVTGDGLGGIVLDAAADKVYWTARTQIRRADLDGGNIENITNPEANAIHDIDLAYVDVPVLPTPTPTPTPTPSPTPTAIFTPLPSPTPGGPAPASDIYWSDDVSSLRHAPAAGCTDGSCADTLVSGEFFANVRVDSLNGHIYWRDPEAELIRRANLDGSGLETVNLPVVAPFSAFDLDPAVGHLYWTEGDAIRRADLDGSNAITIATGLNGPTAITVDGQGDKLYWLEVAPFPQQRLLRSDLNGANVETILVDDGSSAPRPLGSVNNLVVDSQAGWIFWRDSDFNQVSIDRIRRLDLNGANLISIYEAVDGGGGDIAIDPNSLTVYWGEQDGIRAVHYNGGTVQTVVSGLSSTPRRVALGFNSGARSLSQALQSPRPQETANAVNLFLPTVGRGGDSVVFVTNQPQARNAPICTPVADLFEPNNVFTAATLLTLEEASAEHNFHVAGDVDWFAFDVNDSFYRVSTIALGADADTLIQLYAADGATLLASNDNANAPGAIHSELTFSPTAGGRYYLRVAHAAALASCATGYQVLVSLDAPETDPVDMVDNAPPPNVELAPISAGITQPAPQSVLTSLAPVTVTGAINALAPLQSLTVRVDGATIYTQSWAAGVISNTTWSTVWTPPAEGNYAFSLAATDHAGNSFTSAVAHTATVDLTQPAVDIDPVSTAPLIDAIRFSGLVTESVGIQGVEVQLDGGPWRQAVTPMAGGIWRYIWTPVDGFDPALFNLDGGTVALNVRVTDVAGRTAQASRTVTVDTTQPAPTQVTFALQDGTPITSGQTIFLSSPVLVLNWGDHGDGSGIADIYAGWTENNEAEPDDLTRYDPTARSHSQPVLGEALQRYAHVIAVDVHGNQQIQRFGPFFVDSPATPDRVSDLSYSGWINSGATQSGADRTLVRRAAGNSQPVQSLFTSWDEEAIRFAWTGANWDNDGDLFIYLDSAPGGSTTAYNPHGDGVVVNLPVEDGQTLAADYLLWVSSNVTATLLSWNGDWSVAQVLTDSYRFNGDQTDLLLPFTWLNITDPAATSLSLVAFATEDNGPEDDGLRLWASIPDKQPLNSERVLNSRVDPATLVNLSLTQFLTLASLGSGIRPADGVWLDADLEVRLTAQPVGVQIGYLDSGRFDLLLPNGRVDADLDGEIDFVELAANAVPLAAGQTVSFTVYFTNTGSVAMPDATLEIAGFGGFQSSTINLGTVAAGAAGTAQFAVTAGSGAAAELRLTLADATHAAYDWIWVHYDIDTQPPTNVAVTGPAVLRSFGNLLSGSVEDASPIDEVTVAIQLQPSGVTSTLVCPMPSVDGGFWVCPWDAGDLNGVESVLLRARAVDAVGNGSEWSETVSRPVDTSAPSLMLDDETENRFVDGFLSPDEFVLSGLVEDDQQPGQVEICSPLSGSADCRLVATTGGGPAATWQGLPLVGAADGITETFQFTALDLAGNRSAPVSRTARIDNVAPLITVTSVISEIVLVDYNSGDNALLAGLVSDGGGVAQLYAQVQAPDGETVWQILELGGENWRFRPGLAFGGEYLLRIEVYDLAGNVSSVGPYAITVDGPPAVPTRQWDGGAGNGNWSDPANWQPNGLPTAEETVILSGSGVITVDGDFNIGALNLPAGFNGTLRLAGGLLNISGNYVQEGGNVFLGDGRLRVTGDFRVLNGLFEPEDGRLILTPTGDQRLQAPTLNRLQVGDGSIGRWKFSEGGGTVVRDSSGYGQSGVTVNNPTWFGGDPQIFRQTLFFDGVNDHVALGTGTPVSTLSNNFSVAALINLSSTVGNGQHRIIASSRRDSNAGWGFGVQNRGLRFTTFGVRDYDSTVINLPSSAWVHVAAVMDSDNNVTFYVDGVAVQTVTGNAPGRVNAVDPMLIGATTPVGSATPTAFFSGYMDDLSVYDFALTPEQVNALAQRTELPPPTGRLILDAPLDVDGDLILNKGTLDVNSSANYTLTVGGDFVANQGRFNAHGGTVIFDGNGAQNIDALNITFNNVLIDNGSQGLVGQWSLDEFVNGRTLDATSYGNAATIFGATEADPSPAGGRSLRFDGVDDYARIGNPGVLNFSGPIAVTAWIRPEATNGLQNIVAHGHNLHPHGEVVLRINNGSYQFLAWNGANHIVSAPMPAADLNTWVHLAGVYDGTHWRLYRNGVEIAANAGATGAVLVAANWAIGARGTGTERFFRGGIDEVRIYNRGLTAQEVANLLTAARSLSAEQDRESGGVALAAPLQISGTLTLQRGVLDASTGDHPLTLGGDLTANGGQFNARNGAVTFAGEGTQQIEAEQITLANVTVNAGVELQTEAPVMRTGELESAGRITELRHVDPAPSGEYTSTAQIHYGFAEVALDLTELGNFESLQITRIDEDSPNSTPTTRTGKHWLFDATGSGYAVDLSLGHDNVRNPGVCLHLGEGEWDFFNDDVTSETVTRLGVSALDGEWSVGFQPVTDVQLYLPFVSKPGGGSEPTGENPLYLPLIRNE